mgnify:FL=1
MINLIVNHYCFTGKYNASTLIGARFKSCLTQIHLCCTLGIHAHIVIVTSIQTSGAEKVGRQECLRWTRFQEENVRGEGLRRWRRF